MLPDVAEMVEVSPPLTIVATPVELIVAALMFDDAHTTVVVRSFVVLSE